MTVEQHQPEVTPEGPAETPGTRNWRRMVERADAGGMILLGSFSAKSMAIEWLRDPRTDAGATAEDVEDSPRLPPALILDQATVQRLAEEERESHTSVAELVREGLELMLTRRAGLRGVAEWEAEHGELTEDELKAATTRLFGGGSSEKVA